MALARVQASSKVTGTSTTTVVITMATPPTVGNGLIVFVNNWRSVGPATPTATDNKGNVYLVAASKVNGASGATILYCPQVTTGGSSFQITLTGPAATYWVTQVVEVSGVGSTFGPDQSVTASGTSTTPATGSTAALTATETFQAACHGIAAVQSSITVGSVSPAWTQEFEELPFSFIAGEADTRINSSSTGTTPSVSWTDTASGVWSAVLVAFQANATIPPTQAYVSQLPVEVAVLPSAAVSAYVSQLPIEVAVLPASTLPAKLSQLPVEVAVLVPKITYVSQVAVETLSFPVPISRVSQFVVETLTLPPARARMSQVVIETLQPYTPGGGGGAGAGVRIWMGDGGGLIWIE